MTFTTQANEKNKGLSAIKTHIVSIERRSSHLQLLLLVLLLSLLLLLYVVVQQMGS